MVLFVSKCVEPVTTANRNKDKKIQLIFLVPIQLNTYMESINLKYQHVSPYIIVLETYRIYIIWNINENIYPEYEYKNDKRTFGEVLCVATNVHFGPGTRQCSAEKNIMRIW